MLNHVKPSVYNILPSILPSFWLSIQHHSTISINSPSLDHQFTTIRPSKDCVALQCHDAKLPKACPPSFRRRAREAVGKCSAWCGQAQVIGIPMTGATKAGLLGSDWAIPQGGPIIESQSHWLPRLRSIILRAKERNENPGRHGDHF